MAERFASGILDTDAALVPRLSMLSNRYEVLGTIGVGATGRVEKARDTLIGRTVALKTFGHGFGTEELQKQFLREAQIVGRLSHPNIVSLYDIGTDENGIPFLVMEYVAGKTLEQVLVEGPLPLSRAALWAADLATALNRAHRSGVIHGDIKPANVLITNEGDVKLSDFGMSRFATQVSGTGYLFGTPCYISPEQILGNPQDHRSDIFSLGVILYKMATGVLPFNGSSVPAVCAQIVSGQPLPPSQHRKELPASIDRVILRCLAKDPDARYPTADSLATSLYTIAREDSPAPVTAKVPSKAAETAAKYSWWVRPLKPHDIWLFAAGVFLVSLVVGALTLVRNHVFVFPRVAAAPSAPPIASSTQKPVSTPGSTSIAQPNSPVSLSPDSSAMDQTLVSANAMSIAEFPKAPEPVETHKSKIAQQSASLQPSFKKSKSAVVATSSSHPASSLHPTAPQDVVSSTATALPVTPASVAKSSASAPAKSQQSAPEHNSLDIHIVSAIDDEILAIYADQQLIATTPLSSTSPGNTIDLVREIPSGAHQFRVVLYRPDQSLHTQKEGLAEIKAGDDNTLKIRVARHSKLLLMHDAVLEIVWPGAAAPSPITQVKTASASASLETGH